MTIEGVIISFIMLCLCLVLSNLLLYPRNIRLENYIAREQAAMEKEIRARLDQQAQPPGEESDPAYILRIQRKMRRPAFMLAYGKAAERVLGACNAQQAQRYLRLAAPMFSGMCTVYARKKAVPRTCFVHVLDRMLRCGMEADANIREFLYICLRSEALVCRQNAFSAICSSGDAAWTVKALLYMNRIYGAYNDKLLTEGLLRFGGPAEELSSRLWEVRSELHRDFHLAVLNYLRLCSNAYAKEMLSLLRDPAADAELHYAAIRYLGKYPLGEAKPLLLSFLEESGGRTWTYAAVSAQALGSYPGEESFDALKKALFRPEWHVRLNASASLEKLGIDYLKIADVINSSDRYAREIVQYRLEESARRKAQGPAENRAAAGA